eukprot:CAMPEP_0195506718 /NCGR_PEP_ID=MMETSP0794_2-20130614/296_1 /TAXON_ID=515487 /ORGANISM="Stephanopyxis turris, Strain CCMP 815" /LENGTH=279 /DNA_ID=CAMNT_0040633133 /DNA_START=40 /DNA_END=876 /DNA_ORIENTATION=+
MTIKINTGDTPLLSSKPPAVPPSQRRNEDIDAPKASDDTLDDGELVFYSPEHNAAILIDSKQDEFLLQVVSSGFPILDEDRNPSSDEHEIEVDFYVENVPVIVTSDGDLQLQRSQTYNDISRSYNRSSQRVNQSSPHSRRVQFAQPLVTEVRTRPRTLQEDLRSLFYTYEETQRFRQEYRAERQILARAGCDDPIPESSDTSTDSLLNEEEMNSLFGDDYSSWKKRSEHNKYDISRVVVMHNDVLETYDDLQESCMLSNMHKEPVSPEGDFFFDNDSFW